MRASILEPPGTRIYDTLAGLTGRLYVEEERRSWSKDEASLDAYDYYLRGASLYLRFTPADNEKARVVFEEGLIKYPNDGLFAGEARVVPARGPEWWTLRRRQRKSSAAGTSR